MYKFFNRQEKFFKTSKITNYLNVNKIYVALIADHFAQIPIKSIFFPKKYRLCIICGLVGRPCTSVGPGVVTPIASPYRTGTDFTVYVILIYNLCTIISTQINSIHLIKKISIIKFKCLLNYSQKRYWFPRFLSL